MAQKFFHLIFISFLIVILFYFYFVFCFFRLRSRKSKSVDEKSLSANLSISKSTIKDETLAKGKDDASNKGKNEKLKDDGKSCKIFSKVSLTPKKTVTSTKSTPLSTPIKSEDTNEVKYFFEFYVIICFNPFTKY